QCLTLVLGKKVLREVNKEDYAVELIGDLENIDVDIDDEDQELTLLTSLPPSYDNFVETLLYGRESLTLQDVLSSLNLRELKKRKDAKDDGDINKKKSTGFVKKSVGQGSGIHSEGYDNGDLLMVVSEERFLEWIMDSSGSFHMTSRRDFLFDFKEFNGGTILLGDNRACAIMGIGNVRVQMKDGSSFVLENVHYIPELKRNLIYLGTLDREGYTVKLQNKRVKVIKGSLMVLSGTMKGNYVYSLDGWVESGEASVGLQEKESLAQVWHKRLGHITKAGLHELEKREVLGNKGLGKLEFCENCVLGKLTREFNKLCKESEIARHLIVAGTPQQNGLAKRINKTLLNKVRCLLIQFGLPDSFWVETTVTAAYLINRSPSTALEKKTPMDLWSGHLANYEMLRIFGCVAYSQIRRLDDVKPKIIISRDVVFNESIMYKDTLKGAGAADSGKEVEVEVELQGSRVEPTVDPHTEENPGNVDEKQDEEPQQHNLNKYVLVRNRAKRITSIPARYRDEGNVSLSRPSWSKVDDMAAYAFAIAEEEDTHEPITFQEAINSFDKDKWKLVSCKWLYKIKEGIEGDQKPRYKARLVAQGFTQRAGIDYNEVLSPVVRHTSIRVILSLIACKDYELEQLDVKMTFLHGNLEETIYMRQPPSFEEGTGNKVCLLKKSLYGLKQSPRQWYKRFDVYMINNGFSHSSYDSCVYFKEFAPGMYIYLLLYVDDMLITCKSKFEIKYTKGLMRKEFDMKELGPARKILGMKIVRDRSNRTLKVSQSGYVQKILNNYRDVERMSKVPYANVVGSLMYLMVCTRPDISYAVSIVSRYLANLGKNYWEAMKWILKYLKGTADVGLVYGRDQGNYIDVDGFVDADYAKDPNKGRSTTGYVFMVHGCVVSWKATPQHVVALSTTEAEYMALTEAVKESICLKRLLIKLRVNLRSMVVNCDNQSAIHLLRNAMFHERTKHINVRLLLVLDIFCDLAFRDRASGVRGFLGILSLGGSWKTRFSFVSGFKKSDYLEYKHEGSKKVRLKQLGSKQVGFKQLGPGVETGFHGVQNEKHVWFEVELQGAQRDREVEVFQVINDDTAVAQRRARLAKKNELKARGTLLMALPDKHHLKFNIHKDAKSLMKAIKKRLQKLISQLEILGESISQEDINLKFLKSLPSEWKTHTLIWRNKADLEEQSLDDLFNNLKIYEAEVKSSSPTSHNRQNIAFVSSHNTDITNELVRSVPSSNGPQLNNKDLKKIDADDLEEMDLKWQMTILTMRARSYDWSFQADEEPTNYALMTFTSSCSSSSSGSDNETSSKILSKLLKSQITDKTGLGYDNQVFKSQVFDCDELNTSESDDSVPSSLVHDRYKIGKGYYAVPPLYTGTFMPYKPDLVFHDALPVSETVTNVVHVESSTNKTSKEMSKTLRRDAPIIEDWTSDSEDESEHEFVSNQKEPSFVHTSEHVKNPRASVKTIEYPKQAENLKTDNQKSRGNPQQALNDKGVIDSGCSRHMTENISYLSDFEEINGGYVAFGGNPKSGKITGKGKIKTGKLDFDDAYFVKELKFNLFSVSQMVLRENNMYNVDLKNVVPSGDLTCVFAKATLDESNLRHRRLGYINFKIMNKLVKENQPNHSAGIKENLDAGVRDLRDEFEEFSVNSTNRVNAASAPVTDVGPNPTNSFNVASPSDNAVSQNFDIGEKSLFVDPSQYPEADFSNLETNISVSPIPTTRVHKDHHVSQIIGELTIAPQTRSMARMVKEQGGLDQINDKDFHTCMFACFLSQEEPKRVHQALKDPSWI
nr:retrovirus-related Pol polyprotein from transposon TNT 1-94 [Tanacetum cinerariifolium]